MVEGVRERRSGEKAAIKGGFGRPGLHHERQNREESSEQYGLHRHSSICFYGDLKAAVLGQMDLLGCTLVGFTTAVGGGTVRDFMLGNTPVFWLRQPQYIALGVLSSLATFFAFPILRKGKGLEFTETEQQVLDWADSICLGAFCVVGAMSATKAGLHWLVVPVVGMVTSTFGGIIRDLLCRQKPWVCHTDR